MEKLSLKGQAFYQPTAKEEALDITLSNARWVFGNWAVCVCTMVNIGITG